VGKENKCAARARASHCSNLRLRSETLPPVVGAGLVVFTTGF
jgi:hypothetical protein